MPSPVARRTSRRRSSESRSASWVESSSRASTRRPPRLRTKPGNRRKSLVNWFTRAFMRPIYSSMNAARCERFPGIAPCHRSTAGASMLGIKHEAAANRPCTREDTHDETHPPRVCGFVRRRSGGSRPRDQARLRAELIRPPGYGRGAVGCRRRHGRDRAHRRGAAGERPRPAVQRREPHRRLGRGRPSGDRDRRSPTATPSA